MAGGPVVSEPYENAPAISGGPVLSEPYDAVATIAGGPTIPEVYDSVPFYSGGPTFWEILEVIPVMTIRGESVSTTGIAGELLHPTDDDTIRGEDIILQEVIGSIPSAALDS